MSRSLRAVQLQARLPAALASVLMVVLTGAGVRSILTRARTSTVFRPASSSPDQGAQEFAQAFARAYLTWDGDEKGWHGDEERRRASALAPFLSSALDPEAGLRPGNRSRQSVGWTAVIGEQTDGARSLVTAAALTSNGVTYLSVPVTRDRGGFLLISGYPALVGPPSTSDPGESLSSRPEVTDPSLQTVLSRAVADYLAGERLDLRADLTRESVVSLPAQRLTVTTVRKATWVVPERRVAIQVVASDARGDSWTLSYELDVQKLGRWYVRSIEVDPMLRGGTP